MTDRTDTAHAASPPRLEGIEDKWARHWDAQQTYAFDRSAPRDAIYSIDTPPPTVSGSLHVGHVFSFTHADIVARFQRMNGRAVFYPMGWDDNGLPTERRVEQYFGVVCDPAIPYDPAYQPPATPAAQRGRFARISRRNFVALCHQLTAHDEQAFRALFVRLGLSVDWRLAYTTIGTRAQRASQRALLRNARRGELYNQEAPCLWDVTFRTAVAQAELEEREVSGAYHDLRFADDAGREIVVATTRPELLPACVALVAHPDDARYQARFGRQARCPLFGLNVPILAHPLADPAKGSGIAMACTFGDLTDVIWWRELDLPTRAVLDQDGRLRRDTPAWIDTPDGAAHYARLGGHTAADARRRIADALAEAGALACAPRPVTHAVKFFEKGDRPLEIIATRQWYLRNGGRDPSLRAALRARGDALQWHPGFMGQRYAHWVDGLNGDWLISRQRVFGVPLPFWYPLDATGAPDYDAPLHADEAALPIDPRSHVPPGYREAQRGQPNGFVGETDVMDTWATSSLTPQIAAGWEEPDGCFEQVFPMDLRPQAHDIIRTWLFGTTVRAHLEHGRLPWRHAMLSGWILDPDRKKMSKSKGNVVTPAALLERYGSDGVRYWAALGRPGADAAFDETQMRNGRRLALKLLNVSTFVLGFDASGPHAVSAALDRAMLARIAACAEQAGTALASLDYAKALAQIEADFWWYCDDYVELVKARAHRADAAGASARHALRASLSIIQRLFAPYLPFVAEEVWSRWQAGSIHRAAWPDGAAARALAGASASAAATYAATDVLRAIRKAKSDAKVSMKAEVACASVGDSAPRLALIEAVRDDLVAAGRLAQLALAQSDAFRVDVTLV
ncbi:valine--tRNA ligase [Burkholderia sp. FERM BP-3421]|uniref:valine--tRNA ligase n=1 Tax=Burkholderia sp. FERM BP-3421 TaxID=1494466 RepID=UPI00235F2A7F|nr:valine--tRNA ligase [Burkholderia sp. FERM BP-3421]WDD90813.1 valine--tRNA ligase [Burkholderia sp. FERM BP-3421]